MIAATQAGQAILVADSLLQTALIESLRGQFDAVRDRLGSVRNALEEARNREVDQALLTEIDDALEVERP